MSIEEAGDDPFMQHLHRDPLPNAGIHVLALVDHVDERAQEPFKALCQLIAEEGRAVEGAIASVMEAGAGLAIEQALARSTLPLVLVTTACESWTPAHLRPLLEAVARCDHVYGCRPRANRGQEVAQSADSFAGSCSRSHCVTFIRPARCTGSRNSGDSAPVEVELRGRRNSRQGDISRTLDR